MAVWTPQWSVVSRGQGTLSRAATMQEQANWTTQTQAVQVAKECVFISTNGFAMPYMAAMMTANPQLILAPYVKSIQNPTGGDTSGTWYPAAWYLKRKDGSKFKQASPSNWIMESGNHTQARGSVTRSGPLSGTSITANYWAEYHIKDVVAKINQANAASSAGGTHPLRGIWFDSESTFSVTGAIGSGATNPIIDPSTGAPYTTPNFLTMATWIGEVARNQVIATINPERLWITANGLTSGLEITKHNDMAMWEGVFVNSGWKSAGTQTSVAYFEGKAQRIIDAQMINGCWAEPEETGPSGTTWNATQHTQARRFSAGWNLICNRGRLTFQYTHDQGTGPWLETTNDTNLYGDLTIGGSTPPLDLGTPLTGQSPASISSHQVTVGTGNGTASAAGLYARLYDSGTVLLNVTGLDGTAGSLINYKASKSYTSVPTNGGSPTSYVAGSLIAVPAKSAVFLTTTGGTANVAPSFSADPGISGTAQEGQTLTAQPGIVTGSPAPTTTYQWQRTASASGTAINSGDNIASIINAGAAGDTFVVGAGTYRLTQKIVPKNDMVITGVDAGTVILNGTKLLTGWSGSGPYTWIGTLSGPTLVSPAPSTFLYPQNKWAEQVYLDGAPLWRCGAKVSGTTFGSTTPAAGEYYVDWDADTITLHDNPSGHTLEYSGSFNIIDSTATNVEVSGLTVYGSNSRGIRANAANWNIHHCHATGNLIGIGIPGQPSTVQNCLVDYNGMYGMNGDGDGQTVTDNEIAYNGTLKLYDSGGGTFAFGGMKYSSSIGFEFARNLVHHNEGAGAWWDVNCESAVIENNEVHDNVANGIWYEISYTATIRGNKSWDNGAAGIYVSTSQGCTVSDNDVWGNGTVAGGEAWQIRGIDANRSSAVSSGHTFPHRGVDNTFTGNRIWMLSNAAPSGFQVNTGGSGTWPTDAWTRNTWTANTWHTPATTTGFWKWNGGSLNAAGWQAAGLDPAPPAVFLQDQPGGTTRPTPTLSTPGLVPVTWSDIAAATATTYLIPTGTAGATLRVVETATNPLGSASANSAATGTVTAASAAPVFTTQPSISGNLAEGAVLTVDHGVATGSPTYTYQWETSAAGAAGTWSNITSATSSTYTLPGGSAGTWKRCKVTATNGTGATNAWAPKVGPIGVADVAPSNTAPAVVTGVAHAGEVLTLTPGTWTGTPPPNVTSSWQYSTDGGSTWTDYSPPDTDTTYTISATDEGNIIRVLETASNRAGSATQASNTSAPVTLPSSFPDLTLEVTVE